MTRRSVLLALAALIAGSELVAAHEGHGETQVISGTLRSATPAGLEVETRDEVSLQLKRVLLAANSKTVYKRGKARVSVEVAQPTAGERVSVVAKSEHGAGNSLRWIAIQVELPARKTS